MAPRSAKDEISAWPQQRRWKNVLLLSLAWAFTATGLFINVSATTEAARIIHSEALSTLPVGLFVMGAFASVVQLARLTKRFGRQRVYMTCAALAVVGASCSSAAAAVQSFPLLCAGTVLQGFGFANGNQLRFVATEFLPDRKSTAVSAVILGGVAAAVGPELGRTLRFAHPDGEFIASYICLAALYAAQCAVYYVIDFAALERPAGGGGPPDGVPERDEEAPGGAREQAEAELPSAPPLTTFLRSQRYAVPAAAGALSFVTMAALMAATPLAMLRAKHSFASSVLAVTCHVLGMYVPPLVTPALARRMGGPALLVCGFLVVGLGEAIFLASTAVAAFVVATTLVGVGWAFAYVAASSLIAAATPAAHARVVQAVTDMVIFGFASLSLVFAGVLFAALGPRDFWLLWTAVTALATALALHFLLTTQCRRHHKAPIGSTRTGAEKVATAEDGTPAERAERGPGAAAPGKGKTPGPPPHPDRA